MKKITIVLILIIHFITGYSQKKWVDGYYITLEKDTIHGKILDTRKPATWQLAFLTRNNEKKLFKADEIVGFYYKKKYYHSCFLIRSNSFLERKIVGAISLYSMGSKEYIQKFNGDIERFNYTLRWPILKDYISDNKVLLSEVKRTNTDSLDFQDVILDYNDWYKSSKVEPDSAIAATVEISIDTSQVMETESPKPIQNQALVNFKLNLLGSGAGIETKVTNSTTIYIESGLDINLFNNIDIFPYIKIQPRIYTNINKRYNNGKNTNKYSANYVSPLFVLIYDIDDLSENETEWYLYGLCYGIQRSKAKRFYWGADIGLGMLKYWDKSDFILSLNKYSTSRLEPRIIWNINAGFLF